MFLGMMQTYMLDHVHYHVDNYVDYALRRSTCESTVEKQKVQAQEAKAKTEEGKISTGKKLDQEEGWSVSL